LVTQKRKNLKEEVPSNGAAVNKNPRELQWMINSAKSISSRSWTRISWKTVVLIRKRLWLHHRTMSKLWTLLWTMSWRRRSVRPEKLRRHWDASKKSCKKRWKLTKSWCRPPWSSISSKSWCWVLSGLMTNKGVRPKMFSYAM
jgi:hypothetical protein